MGVDSIAWKCPSPPTMIKLRRAGLILVAIVLTACTASQHRDAVRDDTDRVTVGVVQAEINIGMAAAEVAEVLGSPNIVTTDNERRETWIYDKISTDVAYSRSEGALIGLIFGSSGAGVGVGSTASGAKSTSQRTLTVIIKLDENDRVRDFSYHTSRF